MVPLYLTTLDNHNTRPIIQLFMILIQNISAKLSIRVPIECSLGARINTVEAVDQLTCEPSISISADKHCECHKSLGPTAGAAVISSPSENYYSYYAKTVPLTENGNGTSLTY
jgi:hypothetical protein